MRRRFIAALLLACAAAQAQTPAYDEAANAKADVAAALSKARQDGKPVLVVFGANWCPDCKVLDIAFKQGAAAPLIAGSYHVVKVDVGRFNRNTDLAEAYGVPLKKGIPAVAILSREGQVLHASRGGELADARKMGDSGIHDYFARAARAAPR